MRFRHQLRPFCITAALTIVAVGTTREAHADWRLGGYLGAAHTLPNTLTVTPGSGPAATLTDVEYRGEAFTSPIYYGYRLAWTPGDAGFGAEVEFTHAKTIANDTRSNELTVFRQTHGLNFLLANVAYRVPPSCGGRCTIGLRVGVGVAVPHMESTFRGVTQEQYQYGGIAWQAGIGVEHRLWHGLYGLADARVTRVSEEELRGAGVDIAGTFSSLHVDFGLGWRFR